MKKNGACRIRQNYLDFYYPGSATDTLNQNDLQHCVGLGFVGIVGIVVLAVALYCAMGALIAYKRRQSRPILRASAATQSR